MGEEVTGPVTLRNHRISHSGNSCGKRGAHPFGSIPTLGIWPHGWSTLGSGLSGLGPLGLGLAAVVISDSWVTHSPGEA